LRRGSASLDGLLDDEVGTAADQQEVFDIVPTDEHEPPPRIDGHRVHDAETRRPAPAPQQAEATSTEPLKDPTKDHDQSRYQKKGKRDQHYLGCTLADDWTEDIHADIQSGRTDSPCSILIVSGAEQTGPQQFTAFVGAVPAFAVGWIAESVPLRRSWR